MLVLLGAFGLLVAVRNVPGARWWLAVGAGWFAVQLLALDLDYYPDLLPTFDFVALGIGLALGDQDQPPYAVYGLVAPMVVVSVVILPAIRSWVQCPRMYYLNTISGTPLIPIRGEVLGADTPEGGPLPELVLEPREEHRPEEDEYEREAVRQEEDGEQ